ncbi:uroporphyrinogen-III synthase [Psychroflexus salarius]|mgnify:FL=1|uniref:Uroporphyrinogen-III synthase n=1 Tax=Psychroflexus salarius TaxID=1155689 RepID=A0A1M4VKB9_9FLAO|nr:uroporphyrinogen-III synthase [Psychroflexus salarius]SHE69348.1 uroporphyrinogen-III synthase [Psychroflexus salarius]
MARLLSTKKLTESQRQLVLNTNHSLVEYNAISTEVKPEAIPKRNIKNAIITSQTAAKICIKHQLMFKSVFCVGQKTANLLINAGYNVVLICTYAKYLSQILVEAYSNETFNLLCSTQRLNTIPSALTSAGIEFKEHHIYSTIPHYKSFSNQFDAVLFFSPSGVKSFFSVNTKTPNYLVCIGETTAQSAKKFSKNVSVSLTTSIESCIARAIKLLNNQ